MKLVFSTLVLGLAMAAATPSLAQQTCETGFRLFSHVGGDTCIPQDPQRIVTLSDQNVMLALLELGVTPVGSAGKIDHHGNKVFGRTQGYDTSSVFWLADDETIDAEAVAALDPDLIVSQANDLEMAEKLALIAPVVLIDNFGQPVEDALMQYADLVNKTDLALEKRAALEAKAAGVREQLGDQLDHTTVSIVKFWEERNPDVFEIQSPDGVTGAILRLLPIIRPDAELAENIGGLTDRSWEVVEAHDADVMFHLHYDNDVAGDGGTNNHEIFKAKPLVQHLEVAKANQIFGLDGALMVGISWGKIENGLDQIAAVLVRDDLNRDIVQE
ncbi:MAG: ABC transporter substrate-binding protein [Devosia sp.]|uniref:ABC transporter substrate-binding protein n=1 Tax=Devosia sp. TaxID=1871048 RepID=UPI0024C58378|nr:ABC transporter substrate-binding protein [Devosia sp.]UYN98472.1 MAG: ABC transporter substrate-binding protein [Devosia sp.]